MKATKEYFYNSSGDLEITEAGWVELRKFCESIVYKKVGGKEYTEDIISRALIECVEKLQYYDYRKNDQIFGYLYWTVRGAISKEACANKKYVLESDIEECLKHPTNTII